MKKTTAALLSGLIGSTLVSGHAVADNHDWTGGYVVTALNLSTLNTETNDVECWYACDAPGTTTQDLTLTVGGGYNWQVDGNFVVGVEADISSGQKDTDKRQSSSWADADWKNELEYTMSLRARLGMAVDKTLFYVTGGYAYAEAKLSGEERNAGLNPDRAEYDDSLNGLIMGVGVEHKFTDLIGLRVEYLRSEYQQEEACWGNNAGCYTPGDEGERVSWKNDQSVFRAGVTFNF